MTTLIFKEMRACTFIGYKIKAFARRMPFFVCCFVLESQNFHKANIIRLFSITGYFRVKAGCNLDKLPVYRHTDK